MKYKCDKTPKQIYDKYQEKYQNTKIKPYPDKLLLLLLLEEKEKYKDINKSNGVFYKYYQEKIDKKINQVITDFNLSKEDIITFIEKKGIFYREETYEHDKLWYVFGEAIGALAWAVAYRSNTPKTKIYYETIRILYDRPNFKKLTLKKLI